MITELTLSLVISLAGGMGETFVHTHSVCIPCTITVKNSSPPLPVLQLLTSSGGKGFSCDPGSGGPEFMTVVVQKISVTYMMGSKQYYSSLYSLCGFKGCVILNMFIQ